MSEKPLLAVEDLKVNFPTRKGGHQCGSHPKALETP